MQEQELVISYYQNPVNNYVMQDFSITNSEGNPVCGDSITIYGKIIDNVLISRSFSGQTSMITTASASFFSEIIVGRNINEILTFDKNLFIQNGFNVSYRRQRAMILPLLATINGIYKFQKNTKTRNLDEFL